MCGFRVGNDFGSGELLAAARKEGFGAKAQSRIRNLGKRLFSRGSKTSGHVAPHKVEKRSSKVKEEDSCRVVDEVTGFLAVNNSNVSGGKKAKKQQKVENRTPPNPAPRSKKLPKVPPRSKTAPKPAPRRAVVGGPYDADYKSRLQLKTKTANQKALIEKGCAVTTNDGFSDIKDSVLEQLKNRKLEYKDNWVYLNELDKDIALVEQAIASKDCSAVCKQYVMTLGFELAPMRENKKPEQIKSDKLAQLRSTRGKVGEIKQKIIGFINQDLLARVGSKVTDEQHQDWIDVCLNSLEADKIVLMASARQDKFAALTKLNKEISAFEKMSNEAINTPRAKLRTVTMALRILLVGSLKEQAEDEIEPKTIVGIESSLRKASLYKDILQDALYDLKHPTEPMHGNNKLDMKDFAYSLSKKDVVERRGALNEIARKETTLEEVFLSLVRMGCGDLKYEARMLAKHFDGVDKMIVAKEELSEYVERLDQLVEEISDKIAAENQNGDFIDSLLDEFTQEEIDLMTRTAGLVSKSPEEDLEGCVKVVVDSYKPAASGQIPLTRFWDGVHSLESRVNKLRKIPEGNLVDGIKELLKKDLCKNETSV